MSADRIEASDGDRIASTAAHVSNAQFESAQAMPQFNEIKGLMTQNSSNLHDVEISGLGAQPGGGNTTDSAMTENAINDRPPGGGDTTDSAMTENAINGRPPGGGDTTDSAMTENAINGRPPGGGDTTNSAMTENAINGRPPGGGDTTESAMSENGQLNPPSADVPTANPSGVATEGAVTGEGGRAGGRLADQGEGDSPDHRHGPDATSGVGIWPGEQARQGLSDTMAPKRFDPGNPPIH